MSDRRLLPFGRRRTAVEEPTTVAGSEIPAPAATPALGNEEQNLADAADVARARQDLHAFSPLYERYADPVFGFCLRRLMNRESAADATHQTFSQAMTRLDSFHGRSFRAWLFTIARNVVIDSTRRQRPTVALGPEHAASLVDPDQSPELRAIDAERRRHLLTAMTRLTPDQRAVMDLRLAGLTVPEIAQALGTTTGAAQAHQFRAHRALRRLLADDPAFDAPGPVGPDDPSDDPPASSSGDDR